MTAPKFNQLPKYKGKLINEYDWDNLLRKIIEYLTSGNYDVDFLSITADSYVGLPTDEISQGDAAETINQGNLVRMGSDNKIYKADNTTVAGITNVLGFSTDDYSLGETVTTNPIQYTSFTGLSAGSTYYVGTSGAITSTKPAQNAKPIGLALSTTTLRILKDAGDFSNSNFLDGITINANTISTDVDADILFNAYAGRTIVIDFGTNTMYDGNLTGNWAFNSGNLTGITNLEMSGTLDLGTNTIADGIFTGTWNFDSNTLYIDSVSNNVGIGTNTFDFGGVRGGLEIKLDYPSILISGTHLAAVTLYDQGAGTNLKAVEFYNEAGKTHIRSLDDSLSSVENNFISIDLSTKYIGFNQSSPLAPIHLVTPDNTVGFAHYNESNNLKVNTSISSDYGEISLYDSSGTLSTFISSNYGSFIRRRLIIGSSLTHALTPELYIEGPSPEIVFGATSGHQFTIENVSSSFKIKNYSISTVPLWIQGDSIGINTEPNHPLHLRKDSNATNYVYTLFNLEHRTSGTVTDGYGAEIRMQLEDYLGGIMNSFIIQSFFTDAANYGTGGKIFTADNNSDADKIVLTWDENSNIAFNSETIVSRMSIHNNSGDGLLTLTLDNDDDGENIAISFAATNAGGTPVSGLLYFDPDQKDFNLNFDLNISTDTSADNVLKIENTSNGYNSVLNLTASNSSGTPLTTTITFYPDLNYLIFDNTLYITSSITTEDSITTFSDTGGDYIGLYIINEQWGYNSTLRLIADNASGLAKTLDITLDPDLSAMLIEGVNTITYSTNSGNLIFQIYNTSNGDNSSLQFWADNNSGTTKVCNLTLDPDSDNFTISKEVSISGKLSAIQDTSSANFDIFFGNDQHGYSTRILLQAEDTSGFTQALTLDWNPDDTVFYINQSIQTIGLRVEKSGSGDLTSIFSNTNHGDDVVLYFTAENALGTAKDISIKWDPDLEELNIDENVTITNDLSAYNFTTTGNYIATNSSGNYTPITLINESAGDNVIISISAYNDFSVEKQVSITWNPDTERLYFDDTVNFDQSTYFLDIINVSGISYLTGGFQAGSSTGGTLKFKLVDIGDWNMYTSGGGSSSTSITHGLTYTNIRQVYAMIRSDSDAGTYSYPLIMSSSSTAHAFGSVGQITNTTISLYRITGGFFDTGDFESTSYNRGWVLIWYEV